LYPTGQVGLIAVTDFVLLPLAQMVGLLGVGSSEEIDKERSPHKRSETSDELFGCAIGEWDQNCAEGEEARERPESDCRGWSLQSSPN